MMKQLNLDNSPAISNRTIGDNPNIIFRKGCRPYLHKDVTFLWCVGGSHRVSFDTTEKFYVLNPHGWGWCDKHMGAGER